MFSILGNETNHNIFKTIKKKKPKGILCEENDVSGGENVNLTFSNTSSLNKPGGNELTSWLSQQWMR